MLTEALWKIIDIGAFGGLVAILIIGIYKIAPKIVKLFEDLQQSISSLKDSINEMRVDVKNEIRTQAILTRKSLATNSYTDEKIIDIASDKVLAKSFEKLDYLYEVLLKNDIQLRRKQIEKNIRANLIRYSNEYIKELNSEDHRMSNGILMGEWIENNFQMDEFIDKLFKIFFRQTDENITTKRHNKINDIKILMIEYQEMLWKECKNQLTK